MLALGSTLGHIRDTKPQHTAVDCEGPLEGSLKDNGKDKAPSTACFLVWAIMLTIFVVSPQAYATGITMPDMGLGKIFLVISGSFSVALLF